MIMLDMPETKGGQIQEDFLVTANKVHETWATAELRKLLELQERDGTRDSDLPTMTALIASFRQYLRIINPQGLIFGSFGATLGIADNSRAKTRPTTTGAEQGSSQSKKSQPLLNPPRDCFCGRKHWYKDCYYINPATRPTGWKPRPEVEAKIEEAKRNPKIAQQFRKAMEWQNHSAAEPRSGPTIQLTTTTPIAFDAQLDGNYPFHSMACSF
jgi:hypothetical protein